jgi:hypothetical protein
MPLAQFRTWARTILRGRDDRRRPGRPRLEWLEERLTPDAVSWTGGGDGINWSDVRNWSTLTRLPGPADDVSINAPGTVILHSSGNDSIHSLQSENAILLSGGSLALGTDSAIDNTLLLTGGTLSNVGALSVSGLEQTGGTLTGAGALTIQNQWDWSGGTESGSGHTVLQGNANLSGDGFFSFPQINGRTVDNDGTANVLSGATLGFASNAVWNNQSDGTFVLQGTGALGGFFAGSSGQFHNAGLLQATGPASATVNVPLNNTAGGTVDVQAGTLTLSGGGAIGGTFDLEGNSVLSLNGAYSLQDGTTAVGTGIVSVTNSLTVSGSVSLQGLSIAGGTVTVNSGASLDAGDLLLNGTLTGPGAVAVENDFTWTGGTVSGTGPTTLNGTSEISGGFFSTLTGRTVDNHGTATLGVNSGFQFNNGGTWNNDADGTLVLQSGSSVGNFFAGNAVVNNDGLVQMLGTGSASVGVLLNNNADGTVDVEGGTLTLTTGSSSGTFNAAAGAALTFSNAFTPGYALQDGATGTGDGAIQVNTFNALTVSGSVSLQNLSVGGGTVTVNGGGSLTAGSVTLNGTLTGAGDITVTGNFTWTGGTLSGTGQTTLQGTSTLSGGFFSALNGRTVTNDGTATVVANSGISFQGNAVWNNQPDGSLTLLANSSLSQFFSTGSQFNNAGLLVAGVGSSIGFAVNNSGTALVPAGASLSVGGNYTQTDGTTTVDGVLTASNTVFLNGGLLSGGGTINGSVVNAAELRPGDSPGVLTINGNYTQTADGILDIEIGGPLAGQYDRLAINGTATLAGTLNVILLNGFVPDLGAAFQIMTFHSRSGDFDAENGLDLGNGSALMPTFSGTDLSLVAMPSS